MRVGVIRETRSAISHKFVRIDRRRSVFMCTWKSAGCTLLSHAWIAWWSESEPVRGQGIAFVLGP